MIPDGEAVMKKLDEIMELRTPHYTVESGDTLSAIALRFYGRASLYPELARANGIENPDHIEVGQRITLPEFVGRDV